MVIWPILLIVFEAMYQRFKSREDPFKENIQGLMTIQEFEERVAKGEMLVILDDLVLDVGKWKVNHPGGKFLIDHNIGRDVSKYFYGGYLLENGQGMKPNTHSNVAKSIVN
jgi:cytochrome b involved in lipid metabolism